MNYQGSDLDSILDRVRSYYDDKLQTFGPTPQGVDWNSAAAQQVRFDQILKVCDTVEPFSINDYGCGYGALFERLAALDTLQRYCGYDISSEMLAAATNRYAGESKAAFISSAADLEVADYTVASGIFSVKGSVPSGEWGAYVLATLETMRSRSRRGLAFNCLTAFSDRHLMRDNLYYADPHAIFDYCHTHFSRNVALLHDYGIYEFTILVRL